jgi:hypothetical protein
MTHDSRHGRVTCLVFKLGASIVSPQQWPKPYNRLSASSTRGVLWLQCYVSCGMPVGEGGQHHQCCCGCSWLTPAHMHTCTHAPVYTCTLAHMHTCTHAPVYTCTLAHMHTCTHAMHTGTLAHAACSLVHHGPWCLVVHGHGVHSEHASPGQIVRDASCMWACGRRVPRSWCR